MKRLIALILSLTLALLALASCGQNAGGGNGGNDSGGGSGSADYEPDTPDENEALVSVPKDLVAGANTLTVTCASGSDGCYAFTAGKLTFSGMTEKTVYVLSGAFDGQIEVDAGEEKLELELDGVTLYSSAACPLLITSGDKVTLTAKKGYANFIYDTREAVGEESEDKSSAVYADCDLDLGGKGALTVLSEHNDGIHTKDDLTVQNLTLTVSSVDNALKGNDSVSVTGGTVTLIATAGDGIKTSSTDLSKKGVQRGTVTLTSTNLTVYAGCDGIDAAFDVSVTEDTVLTIYTDKYSPYSTDTTTVTENLRFIRFPSNQYYYSVKYTGGTSADKWVNATQHSTASGGRTTYYYYSFPIEEGYETLDIYIYASAAKQSSEDCLVHSGDITWNTAYDTFALTPQNSSLYYSFTTYSKTVSDMGGGFGPGGGGGMEEGNSDKATVSSKGIKAGNAVTVSAGTVTVSAYDDAIHASGDETMESGVTPTGAVVISGGTLTLFSRDDGVHADGTLTVSGGTLRVTGSYEGLEGKSVEIAGGDVSVVSRDDGINATAASGDGIVLTGGTLYVFAGGDGLDANTKTQYAGILVKGGKTVVISTSSNNSSLDTENGYTYESGYLLALCPSGGMAQESSNCKNFISCGTKTTKVVNEGKLFTAKAGNVTVKVELPASLSALVIFLGSTSATFSVGSGSVSGEVPVLWEGGGLAT